MPTGRVKQLGFTYVGLLILVAMFGVASVGVSRMLASSGQAEKEADLIFIGHQFRRAIASYLASGPRAGIYPPTLEELVQDSRFPTPRHHLRKLYVDPITGTKDWGLVMAPEGGIMGVYSKSTREPKKHSGFDLEDAQFELAAKKNRVTGLAPASSPVNIGEDNYSYSSWKFVYRPNGLPVIGRPALLR